MQSRNGPGAVEWKQLPLLKKGRKEINSKLQLQQQNAFKIIFSFVVGFVRTKIYIISISPLISTILNGHSKTNASAKPTSVSEMFTFLVSCLFTFVERS